MSGEHDHPEPTTRSSPELDALYRSLASTGLVRRLLELARDEDLGPNGDITSALTIPESARARAALVAREPGVISGLAALPHLIAVFAPRVTATPAHADGHAARAGDTLATLEGPARDVLALERTALNLIGRLSGIATRTAELSRLISGTRARLCDTRKTTPGLRVLEKYAVRCGGGASHRLGLHDAVLIKDNHLAGVPAERLGAFVADAARRARRLGTPPAFIEVEVDSLDQADRLFAVADEPDGSPLLDMILLDNFPIDRMREAVRRRDRLAPRVLLEASGGINASTLAAVAATGVDRISLGTLTHGARSLDVALDFLP